jgi:tetratricopeptide (TPR) repeat protein
MAACDRLTALTTQTNTWRSKAFAWRAIAHNRANNRTAAMADINQALALDRDNFEALSTRALLHVNARDFTAALDDLNRAIDREPKLVTLYIRRSNIYLRLHRHTDAIADADADYPYGGAPLLNQRCRARAVAGVEFDKARLACSQALWAQPEAPGYLNTRGLLGLRQKRFDLAWRDFNAALTANPGNARALYGRGLAAIALKREAEGNADIAAAIAIAADIATGFADDGVTLKTVMAQQGQ